MLICPQCNKEIIEQGDPATGVSGHHCTSEAKEWGDEPFWCSHCGAYAEDACACYRGA